MQPNTPYYAVIFTSERTSTDAGYADMAQAMVTLAEKQPGYLGMESARDAMGITVSYWKSLEAIQHWKQQSEHLVAQQFGKEKWYQWYKVRICKVEREYDFSI